MTPAFFVPGYPGSEIRQLKPARKLFPTLELLDKEKRAKILALMEPDPADDLSAPDPIVAGPPIESVAKLLFLDLSKQAKSLYETLDKLGVPFAAFGWDWRRPVWDGPMLERLKTGIEGLSAKHKRPVVIIAHSTGGLVVRCLLEKYAADAAFLSVIKAVVALGVPWVGTLKTLRIMAGQGEVKPFTVVQARRMVALTWAGYDLLPPDPTLTDLTLGGQPLNLVVNDGGAQIGPLNAAHRGWFFDLPDSRMATRADRSQARLGARATSLDLAGHRLPIFNVVGFGAKMDVRATIGSGSGQAAVTFAPESSEDQVCGGGDGTVPRVSAAWLRGDDVRTFHVPIGIDEKVALKYHSHLWKTLGGGRVLEHVLTGAPLDRFVFATVDEGDYVSGDTVRIRMVCLDALGRPLPNAAARVMGKKPGPVSAFPPANEGRHIVSARRIDLATVPTATTPAFRRFSVEIGWDEHGLPVRRERSLVVRA